MIEIITKKQIVEQYGYTRGTRMTEILTSLSLTIQIAVLGSMFFMQYIARKLREAKRFEIEGILVLKVWI